MKRLLLAANIALVGLGAACGHSTTSPTATLVPSQNAAAPSSVVTVRTLKGYVGDSAFRPMSGVRVEVMNGPDAGKELSSDPQGRFSYVGTFPGAVSMRATAEGYLTTTSSVIVGTSPDQAWVSFVLAPVTPPIEVASNYTLTISVDSACSGFPDSVRVRSYQAQLTRPTSATIPANTQFNGSVGGALFAPYSAIFWVGIAGNYVAVSTEGEGPSIVEQVGPKAYIAYMGAAGASVPSGAPATVSAPFKGTIEYCELKLGLGQYYDCSDSLAEYKVQCTEPNSRLTLAPR